MPVPNCGVILRAVIDQVVAWMSGFDMLLHTLSGAGTDRILLLAFCFTLIMVW